MRTLLTLTLFVATPAALPAAEPTVVLHADAPKLLATPLGAAIQGTPNWLIAAARTRTEAFGLTPGDLTTIDATFDLKTDGVSIEFAASKPFNREKFQKAGTPTPPVKIAFPDPKLLRGTVGDGAGPAADAVKAAHFGDSFFAAALAPGRLPPRQMQALRLPLRNELARFAPLLDAEVLRLQLAAGDNGATVVAVQCIHKDAAKREELHTVFANFLKVAATFSAISAADERQTGPNQPGQGDFRKLAAAFKAATVTDTPAGPTLTMILPGDFPFAAFVPTVLGLENPTTALARSERATSTKQIALAMHNFEGAYGRLPAATIRSKDGKPLLSWRVAVLPFLDQVELYNKFKLDEPWDSEHNKRLIPLMPAAYGEPEGSYPILAGTTRAQVFVGKGCVFEPGATQGTKFTEITDGTVDTILIASAATPVSWTKPDDMTFDPKADPRKLLHFVNGVTPLAFCDGSAHVIGYANEPAEWRKLVTRNDGQVVSLKSPG